MNEISLVSMRKLKGFIEALYGTEESQKTRLKAAVNTTLSSTATFLGKRGWKLFAPKTDPDTFQAEGQTAESAVTSAAASARVSTELLDQEMSPVDAFEDASSDLAPSEHSSDALDTFIDTQVTDVATPTHVVQESNVVVT